MRTTWAKVSKFCEGSYDVSCEDCGRTLCTDQDFYTAEKLADDHNDVLHQTRLAIPGESA